MNNVSIFSAPLKPVPCKICRVPLCSEDCAESQLHLENECQIIKSCGDFDFQTELTSLSKCVMVLRLLLLKDREPETYKELMKLMDHNEVRKKDKETWDVYQTTVVDYIQERLQLGDRFSSEVK